MVKTNEKLSSADCVTHSCGDVGFGIDRLRDFGSPEHRLGAAPRDKYQRRRGDDPSDGTHTGVYEWKDGAVNALFDDGTEEQFTVKNDGESPLLVVPYGGYEVYFIKQ